MTSYPEKLIGISWKQFQLLYEKYFNILKIYFELLFLPECANNGQFWWLESRRAPFTRIYRFLHKVLNNIDAQAWKVQFYQLTQAFKLSLIITYSFF